MNDPSGIRLAMVDDLVAINEIYNHYVLHSTCTYQREPEALADRAAWFSTHDERHPITVTEQDGAVVGWASLSGFRGRWGYRFSAENSVYVRHDLHGRGIGRALLCDLIGRARALGYHTLVAGISAEQAPSIALHRRLGFVPAGHLREVGHKFEQWLDVVFLQLML